MGGSNAKGYASGAQQAAYRSRSIQEARMSPRKLFMFLDKNNELLDGDRGGVTEDARAFDGVALNSRREM
jgi:hypothetical protein